MNRNWQRLRPVIIPSAAIFFLTIVGLFGGKRLLTEIIRLKSELQTEQTKTQTLRGKMAMLQEIQESIIPYSENAVIALPSSNSSLAVLSELRALATELNLAIESLSLNTREEERQSEFSSVDIEMEISGSYAQVFTYLKELTKLMPLVSFQTVEVSVKEDSLVGNLTLRSFWAPFPDKLPTLSGAVTDLTEEEKVILLSLDGFRKPEIIEESGLITREVDSQNANPFSPVAEQ